MARGLVVLETFEAGGAMLGNMELSTRTGISRPMQFAVVENGVVHLGKMNVVRDFGREVEVDSGVKRGNQVILNPSVDLADGDKVRTRAAERRFLTLLDP